MSKDNKKIVFIILTSLLTIIILYIVDQVLHLNYFNKIITKLVLFSMFPLVYINLFQDNFIKESIHNKKLFAGKLSYILGILVFAIIIIAYIFIKQYINVDILITEFEEKYIINKSNILYYGIYLSFVNSLLEEFFFRGFIFLNLKKVGMKPLGYIISSIMFAIYHLGNIQNWFNIWVFILAISGLFIGGIIFNYLDDNDNTFLNSWFVHICADLAIVGIGLNLFEII